MIAMFERFSRKSMAATGAALLAALGVSGVAIAQGGNGASPSPKAQSSAAQAQSTETPGVESNAPENSAKDGDNVQYTAPGDPDYKGAATGKTSTVANTSSASRSAGSKSAESTSAAEAPGTEQSPASEQSGSEQPGTESGSEVSNNDGPGGHADEPGNPNADHQFQGQE
jgi:hypothetical protein